MFEEQAAWFLRERQRAGPPVAPSPLHTFASARGIATPPDVGARDDWPHDGAAPKVVALGGQLLVFVDWTVTFPDVVGALVYGRGGRVSVELDHSHEPIVVSHEIWREKGSEEANKVDATRAIDAFRVEVESGALAPLYERGFDPGTIWRPVVASGFWPGMITLVHAPADVAEGACAIAALAEKHGLLSRFSLFETPLHHAGDPLVGYRAYRGDSPGAYQAVLWRAGADLVATVRVVRDVTGLSVSEASELVARVPIEVLRNVAQADAIDARDALCAIGADAEVLGPERFRKK